MLEVEDRRGDRSVTNLDLEVQMRPGGWSAVVDFRDNSSCVDVFSGGDVVAGGCARRS